MALNGGMRMEYRHAVSFKIDCADQAEVDRLWDTLIANGGQAERCGWLKDRYGLSWQIVPTTLPKYLGGSWKSTPASAEFVVAFANPKASRLVYRYSILPRIVSVIAHSTPAPAVQPNNHKIWVAHEVA